MDCGLHFPKPERPELGDARISLKLLREFAIMKRNDGWPACAHAMARAIDCIAKFIPETEDFTEDLTDDDRRAYFIAAGLKPETKGD